MSPFPSPSHKEIISTTLVKYTNLTTKDLVNDPLSTKIKSCDSPTAICHVFRQLAQAFGGNPMLMTCLEVIVGNLQALSLVADPQAVSPPVQLVFSSINILLAMAKSDAANHDPLVDLFGFVEIILKRLKIYPDASVVPDVTQMLVKIMAELVFVFAIATKDVTDGPLWGYTKKLRADIDVEKILCRLDRLTPEEAQRTVTPTLEVIYHLVHNLTQVMACFRVLADEGASTEGINQALFDIRRAVTEKAGVGRFKLQEELRRWLSPPDPSTNHNIARKAHHDGTATWFVEDKTFSQWKATGGQLLWIHGTPGSGKTVMCSTIIDRARLMRVTGLAAVGYFYVDSHDHTKQDARSLLSSLLAQLCTQSDPFFGILSKLRAKHKDNGERPSEDALAICLREMLEYPGQMPVFIVVDALDECPDSPSPGSPPGVPTPRQSVLKIVKWLMELKLQNLHFCLTSRPEFDIQQVLDPLKPASVSLHTQKGQIDDIVQYVESVVESGVTMKMWPKETKALVVDTLTNKSHGMFRWASCQLEILRDCHLRDIQAIMDAFPSTLTETYERVLKNIGEHRREVAHHIFQFLTVSARPLSVQELAEVLAISSDEELAGIPKLDVSLRESDAEFAVRSVCSSLIAIDDINGEKQVRFSHFSVLDFLTSNRLGGVYPTSPSTHHVLPQLAHIFSAKVCLSVLLMLNDHISKDYVKQALPLVTYAAQHWVDHVKSVDPSSLVQLEGGMVRLFDKKRPQFAAWIWVYDIDNPSGPHLVHNHPRTPEKSPLYYAALCGFLNMVEYLAKSHPNDVNTPGSDGRTPLHAALRNGNSGVALALLEKGADANAQDNRGETPLQIASWRGDIEVMESLLNREANLDAKNKDNKTPLSLASSKGNLEAVRLLLDRRPDLAHQQVALQRTALHLATIHGHQPIAQLLLDRGADINAEDEHCQTPLHLAADRGGDDIASLLLQRGAKVNVRDASKLTPLHLASLCGQLKVAEVLLDKDARVNVNAKDGHPDPLRALLECGTGVSAQDVDGWTPLHMAAYNGHEDLARFLVECGADVTAQNNDRSTPLHLASQFNHTNLTSFLVEQQDKDGSTPLHQASKNGLRDRTLVLLEEGADANSQDENDVTPLHLASRFGHLEIVRALLTHGAYASPRDESDWTPLHFASEEGRVEIVRLLLDHSKDNFVPPVDVNVESEDQQTPLFLASRSGRLEVAQFLLERGANFERHDWLKRTPLHAASRNGHDDVTRLLLGQGAKVNAKEERLWTPLHMASKNGEHMVIRLLLDHGAEVGAQNDLCRTPLHMASQEGHLEVVLILLRYSADVHTLDVDGETALHLAAYYGHLKVTEVLLKHYANIYNWNKKGETPFDLALKAGHQDVAKLLAVGFWDMWDIVLVLAIRRLVLRLWECMTA